MNGADKATDFDRFKTGACQPGLGDTARGQAHRDGAAIEGVILPIQAAKGGMWGNQLLAYPFGYINSHTIGLRFGQGLPAYDQHLGKVDAGHGHCLACSRSGWPATWITAVVGGILDSCNASVYVVKAQSASIQHIHPLHPYLHIVGRQQAYLPGAVGQVRWWRAQRVMHRLAGATSQENQQAESQQ